MDLENVIRIRADERFYNMFMYLYDKNKLEWSHLLSTGRFYDRLLCMTDFDEVIVTSQNKVSLEKNKNDRQIMPRHTGAIINTHFDCFLKIEQVVLDFSTT